MNLEEIESYCLQLLDIELYSAEEVLKAQGCSDQDKNMVMAYIMAINRAKKIIPLCFKQYGNK